MKKSMKVLEEIEKVKAELETVKPRSRRKIELEDRLRNLVTKLLRNENQISRKGETLLLKRKPRTPSLGQPKSLQTGNVN